MDKARAKDLLKFLEADIRLRGGTGRRLERLLIEGPVVNEELFRSAVQYLVDNNLAWLDRKTGAWIGWVYLVPGKMPNQNASGGNSRNGDG